ncbi:MAG: hypothetical protein MZV70_60190 [Desulfobacterales bacterium]|nr:hypothetical protein [Desulfobacterales bacterium]
MTFTFSDFESYKYTGDLLDMDGTWTNGTTTGTWSAKQGITRSDRFS